MPWPGSRFSPGSALGRRDDNIFGERFEALFREAYCTIKSINPACSVGVHLGHSAVEDKPVLGAWFDRLAADKARPDFMFYDLYSRLSPTSSATRRS